MTKSRAPIHYSMIIEWDPRDDIFVVTVPELNGCRTHGSTYEEAVQQGQEAIESWLGAMEEWNRDVPPPRTFAQGRWTWPERTMSRPLAKAGD
jgi:predicted RNase H-like HicB family nuclease